MDEVTLVTRSVQLIRKDFGLEDDMSVEEVLQDFDWLIGYLTSHVRYLLDHDFSQFLNAMYRIDISEESVREVLSAKDIESIPNRLALLIIKREQEKVITRARYPQQ